MINQQAQYATDILHQYANENGIHARDTSDLSPLEQWLIFRLFATRCTECNGTGRWKDDESDPEIECPKCGANVSVVDAGQKLKLQMFKISTNDR